MEEGEDEETDDDNQELSTEFHNEGIQNDDISIPSFLQGPDEQNLNEFHNVLESIDMDVSTTNSLNPTNEDDTCNICLEEMKNDQENYQNLWW